MKGKRCKPRSDAAFAAPDLGLHCLHRLIITTNKGKYSGFRLLSQNVPRRAAISEITECWEKFQQTTFLNFFFPENRL